MERNSVVFDGECNLCNGVIAWLLQFAPEGVFAFVPFQSPKGQHLLIAHGFPTKELSTVILFDENGAHTRSDGFLKIVAKIPRYRLVATLLAFVPRILRDSLYDLAAKKRVQWFGRSNSCTVGL